jgi:hypothetical protein
MRSYHTHHAGEQCSEVYVSYEQQLPVRCCNFGSLFLNAARIERFNWKFLQSLIVTDPQMGGLGNCFRNPFVLFNTGSVCSQPTLAACPSINAQPSKLARGIRPNVNQVWLTTDYSWQPGRQSCLNAEGEQVRKTLSGGTKEPPTKDLQSKELKTADKK